MQTLITGVKGFIGHHLYNFLTNEGYNVIGIDLSDDSDADLHISAFDLPLEDESVDYVYSRHFIEHFDIENLEKLFSEIQKTRL